MKKLLALLITMVLIGTIFVGCGVDENEEKKSTTNNVTDAEKEAGDVDELPEVELRIVTMFGGTDPSTEVFQAQLDAFVVENPNVKIKNESITSIGDEFRTAVKTDFSTGNEADITFFYTGPDAAGIIQSGMVMSIDEMRADYPTIGADINPAILDSMKAADGKSYAFPLTGFYEGLFVNKDLFEQYNLELPTTWENFTTAAEVFRENDMTALAAPLSQSHYMIEHFIFAEAGLPIYSETLKGDVPAEWITGLNNIKAFYEMDAFSADSLTMDIEMSQNLFKQEKAAMILEGSWFVGGCEDELRDKMTVLPMPSSNKKDPSAIVAGFTSGYFVSRSSYEDAAKQEAVMNLVNYLTTKEAIGQIAAANGGTPSADVAVEGLHQVYLDGNAMAASASGLELPINDRINPEAFNYIVNEGVPFIVYGERTAEDVLAEVKKMQNVN